MRESDQRLGEITRLGTGLRLYLYSAAVGLVAGSAAVVFTYGLQLSTLLLLGWGAGLPQAHAGGAVGWQFSFLSEPAHAEPRSWVIVLLPALGGLVGALFVHRWAPEAQGAGVDSVIDAFHNKRGVMRPVVAPIKALASILTLSSGGSGGVQGPMTQIGASLGSWIGARLRLSPRHRRILLLAGTAGGLGAIFRAPLGGAVTSVEVLYREDFESDALIPCVISSISAYVVFVAVFGFSHIFEFPDTLFTDVREIAAYLVLGLVCAGAGVLYIKVFRAARDRFFERLRLPRYLTVAVGGLLVGLLGLVDPRVLGVGFGVLQESIRGELAVQTLVTLALLKILATSCSIGSGGAGGVFGPSLFIGGMLGGAVGIVGHELFPGIVTEPGAYVVVGMASFFGGVANTPLAALIIVTEMTGSYHLLPPLMLVGAIALIAMRGNSIYDHQVPNRFHSPAHLRDVTVDLLKRMTVGAVMGQVRSDEEAIVTNETPYFSLAAVSRRLGHLHFIVVDGDGRYRGMLRLNELDLPDDDPILRNLLLVEDLVAESVDAIRDTDDLHQALEKLLESGFDKLPVLRARSEAAEGELIGYLKYSDLLRIYDGEMARLNAED